MKILKILAFVYLLFRTGADTIAFIWPNGIGLALALENGLPVNGYWVGSIAPATLALFLISIAGAIVAIKGGKIGIFFLIPLLVIPLGWAYTEIAYIGRTSNMVWDAFSWILVAVTATLLYFRSK